MAIDFPLPTDSPFLCPENGLTYSWNNAGGYWEVIAYNPDDGGAAIDIGDTPPDNPEQGDLWWNSDDQDGRMYIYYEEAGGSSQWVDASPPNGGGSSEVADLQSVTNAGNTTTTGASFGSGNILLNADGSATFAGNVKVTDGTFDRVSFGLNGLVQVFRNTTNAANGLVRLHSNVNENRGEVIYIGADGKINIGGTPETSPNIGLNADGEASFSGNVLSGSEPGNGAATGAKLGKTGFITITRDGAQPVFSAYTLGSSDKKIEFLADGSAVFTGNVTAPNVFFNLEPDNEANYTVTTDVDEEGNETENRVYNGPTLDVKERLLNLASRLDSLEADEVSDDATSSALLTLISSLSSRLDAKDAAIQNLTTRIQALEGGN